MADVPQQRYTPGKPEPNHVEFLAAVGSDLWISNIVWSGDISEKYGKPETKLGQMEHYIEYFRLLHKKRLQPHIFYIDARWRSLPLMQKIDEACYYGVLSCSVK